MTLVTGQVRPMAAWYASGDGGRILFSVSSDLVSTALGTTTVAAFTNPATSGKTAYLHRISIGATANGTMRSLRNATISGGTAVIPFNRGGGPLASVTTFVAGSSTITVGSGTISKARVVSAYAKDETEEHGALTLLPGQTIAWQYTPTVAGSATVNLVWWEV